VHRRGRQLGKPPRGFEPRTDGLRNTEAPIRRSAGRCTGLQGEAGRRTELRVFNVLSPYFRYRLHGCDEPSRMTTSTTCATCGRALDAHNRHVRFKFPDPVLATSEDQRARTWQSDPDPNRAVMMQVPEVGPFLRALLPVHLSGGYTLTFGLWLLVRPDDLQRAFRVWWSPEYSLFKVDGWLANAIPPWGLLTAPVSAVVRDPNQTPYCDKSSEPTLARILGEEWPHEDVLGALPGDLGRT